MATMSKAIGNTVKSGWMLDFYCCQKQTTNS